MVFGSRQNHPAHTEARDAVWFGQTVHADTEQIWRETSNGCVFGTIHDQAIIDFIRKDNQAMLARNLDDFQQHLIWIESPGRVIGDWSRR